MNGSRFYDADLLKQLAVNLFYGWGYNFYRLENQLRADDQMIRAKAAWMLEAAAQSLTRAEASFRRERMAPPTREHPFADPETLRQAGELERAAREIMQLSSRLQALPTPANDRMTERYRQEAPTLARLRDLDEVVVGRCELLRQALSETDYPWVLNHLAEIRAGLLAIEAGLRDRQTVLQLPLDDERQ